LPATVRFAVNEDVHALSLLRWASRSERERATEELQAFSVRFRTWLLDALASQQWHVAVAEGEDSTLLGCMYLHRVQTVPVPGTLSRAWGYVTHAYVTEHSRRAGLGTTLLSLLVARARELGLHELRVWPSPEALSLYVRAGFRSPEAQRAEGEEPSYALSLGGRGDA
jgi:GNAT superfamily N-acetyltransferase